MKISIITAVYNREDTVERAVRSLLHQDYHDVEHVVIDGGSTDATLDRLRPYIRPNAKIVSEPDLGVYDAINKGLSLITGEVVGLLHSDDFLPRPDILSEIATHFQDDSVDAVYGDAVFFHPGANEKIVRRYSSARFSAPNLGWGCMPAHTTLFLRRSVYQKFGRFKLDYRIAADFDFICRIFRNGKLKSAYIPKVLIHMQTGGISTRGWRSTLTLNVEMMRACRENRIRTNWIKLLSKYLFKIPELWKR